MACLEYFTKLQDAIGQKDIEEQQRKDKFGNDLIAFIRLLLDSLLKNGKTDMDGKINYGDYPHLTKIISVKHKPYDLSHPCSFWMYNPINYLTKIQNYFKANYNASNVVIGHRTDLRQKYISSYGAYYGIKVNLDTREIIFYCDIEE